MKKKSIDKEIQEFLEERGHKTFLCIVSTRYKKKNKKTRARHYNAEQFLRDYRKWLIKGKKNKS